MESDDVASISAQANCGVVSPSEVLLSMDSAAMLGGGRGLDILCHSGLLSRFGLGH